MQSESAPKSLLPDFIKQPIMMLWVYIIPQLILLAINLRSYWIISDEVSDKYVGMAYAIFAYEIVLIGMALAVWSFYRFKGSRLNVLWSVFFLSAQIGFLWFTSAQMGRIIPNTIEPWILNQGSLFLYQFTFMMPGLFYAGLRLACFDYPLKKMPDMAFSLALAIGAPAAFYVIFILMNGFLRGSGVWIPAAIASVLFIGTTVMAFIGIIRSLVLLYNFVHRDDNPVQVIMAIFVALVGPLLGLLLNSRIPFPADFQAPWVYLLAVINGLLVMMPNSKRVDAHGYFLFARCVMLPFSLYFFLVFLPFLPLSLPAMFAVGLGCLILVPSVLFIFHLKKVYDDFKLCERNSGVVLALVLMISGCSILPGYFVFQASQDKLALKSALDYVYSPDYRQDQVFTGSLKSVKRTLINLKKSKEGIQLPYLSGFYNQMVFEGMVLPDSKADYLYQLFFGEEMPAVVSSGEFGFYGAITGTGRGGWRRGVRRAQRDRNVELSEYVVTTDQVDDVSRAQLHLRMTNLSQSDTAEFFAELKLPASVLITDFQLLVGDEMVPGRIFEKRAALWVYQMIRDFTRRDPGILTYTTPTRLDFNIYPFTREQLREASIEFSFPTGTQPMIQLGDQAISLTDLNKTADGIYLQKTKSDQAAVIFSERQLSGLPKQDQQPYLHFIIDYSQGAAGKLETYLRQIDLVVKEYGDSTMGQARFTAANFDMQPLGDGYVNISDAQKIRSALEGITLEPRGGLNIERVIKAHLIQERQSLESNGKIMQPHPLFVVVTHSGSKLLDLKKMDFFQNLLPYENRYLFTTNPGSIEQRDMWSKPIVQPVQESVRILVGGVETFVPALANHPHVVSFQGNINSAGIKVFDDAADKNSWVQVQSVKVMDDQSKYAKGLRLNIVNNELFYNPSAFEEGLTALVGDSKKLRVMSPSTSFIVVERSSQWKTLELKERQRLSTSEGLEFEEDFRTPTPSIYLLMVMMLLWYWWRLHRSREIHCSA